MFVNGLIKIFILMFFNGFINGLIKSIINLLFNGFILIVYLIFHFWSLTVNNTRIKINKK